MGNFRYRDQITKRRLKKLANESRSYYSGAYFDVYKYRYVRSKGRPHLKKYYKRYLNKVIRHKINNNLNKNYEDLVYNKTTAKRFISGKIDWNLY